MRLHMNRDDPMVLDLPDLRAQLLARLAQARATTDALFDSLDPELLYQRPIAERHRVIFYLGHLEAFDWNLLNGGCQGEPATHLHFHQLFAFGIDPVDGGLPTDVAGDWPDLSTVQAYRQSVRHALDTRLATLPMAWPGPWHRDPTEAFDAACLLNVAIEHRLMHAETLSYMLHRLPVGSLRAAGDDEAVADEAMPPWHEVRIDVPAGGVVLGEGPGHVAVFGWDNEIAAHDVEVPAFASGKHLVSNGQYLAFMADGGYERAELWSPEDWAWRLNHAIEQPVFWRREGHGPWWLRTMHQERRLPLDWPVYVSHAEACAYARWAGKALPTEAQWMRAATVAKPLEARQCNADFQRWDPVPVQARSNVSDFGVVGMFGNGWEWTSSVFTPFEGFQAFPFYPGYSKDFFDGRHFVLKGGSPRTAACMLRPGFRNWFQAHYQHVYAGFRCVTASR